MRTFAFLVLAMAAGRGAIAQPPSAEKVSHDQGGIADFYRLDQVQTVHVRIADADRQRLQESLPRRVEVPASFQWRDQVIEDVSIRYKGNSSSNPRQSHKRSYLIQFDEYERTQTFLGMRRVSFDNGVQFGSLFSEPIVTEILRQEGIVTHRCNYARLFVNSEYQGVYVNVERIDDSFIARYLSDTNGLLFKVDEGGPGGNLRYLGDQPSLYRRAFEPKSDSAKDGMPTLIEFIKAINQTPAEEFVEKLETIMEVDDFLKVTAVMLFAGAFDQLTGWNPHNYYLYLDTNTGRWRYLPWDLDVGFSEIAFGRIHVLADWNAAWPIAGHTDNPLLERIVSDPQLLQRYRQTAREILDKHFTPERLNPVIEANYALIKQDLHTDPFPHRRATNPDDRSYDDIVASIKEFVRKRYASAIEQLDNPGAQRPVMPHRPHGNGPGMGPPPQFVEKVQRIERLAQQMQRQGQDVKPIQRLMEQVGPLMQQGKIEEAEKRLDEALSFVDQSLAEPGR